MYVNRSRLFLFSLICMFVTTENDSYSLETKFSEPKQSHQSIFFCILISLTPYKVHILNASFGICQRV